MPFILKKYQFVFPSIITLLLFATPLVTSTELYSGTIIAKEIWFWGVVALILFYFAVKLVFTKKKLLIQLNLVDIFLLLFYVWCFIRACFDHFTPFYYNHKLQLLTGCVITYFFIKSVITNETNKKNEENTIQKRLISGFLDSIFFTNSFIYSLLIFLFILSGFLQALYGLLQLYGFYTSNHTMFKITGSFFNPAPYALFLAVVFPMALGQYLFSEDENIKRPKEFSTNNKFFTFFHSALNFLTHSFLKYLSIATITTIILILPATMIRAAWLGTLAGSLVVLQVKYNYLHIIKGWLNSKTRIILVFLAVFIILTAAAMGLYKLKEGSSIGKSFIWEVTLGKIVEAPFSGHGLGRFEVEYNNWQAEYFQKHPDEMDGPKGIAAGNTKYCFNEYLEIASEIGIIGLGLFLGAIITVLLNLNKKKKQENNKTFEIGDSDRNIIFISSISSFLLLFLFSFPLYSVPTLLFFFIIMAIGSAGITPFAFTIKLNIPSILRYALAALSLFCICLLIINTNKHYNTYYYWDEAQKLYSSGSYNDANNSFGKACKQNQFNGLLIQSYGKSLVMDSSYIKGITMLELAQHYTSDEVLYTTMGDCHKALKQYLQAEKAYQYASYMVPHKLYPHYLLAKLYVQSGDTLKAYKKAKMLLGKKAKVKSIAEEEIKKEMLEIINKSLSKQNKKMDVK
jgi:O-antigen ligase